MSIFNTTSTGTKTTNLAGGPAYSQSPALELLSILLTHFGQDQYYRTAGETFERLKFLIDIVDPKFTAKAAIYARNEFGMRTITHVVASELSTTMARGAKYKNGDDLHDNTWLKSFYDQIIRRPDDMIEIMAYHKTRFKKYPRAMLKGFAKAFDRFDAYQLAKYRSEGKDIKLVDVVNVCHPKPTEKNAEALSMLMRGELKSTATWEAMLTRAGQSGSSEEQTAQFKKEAWIALVRGGNMPYLALLRNIRNILEQAPEVLDEALVILTDPERIKKSLVLPFRYMSAYYEISKEGRGMEGRAVLMALNRAVDISFENVPVFEGETLVVVDVSGSMIEKQVTLGAKSPHRIASLFAAAIAKANNADIMLFAADAKYHIYNPKDTITSIAAYIHFGGGSTNFHAIFQRANRKYDRIIILSDMQGWVDPRYSPVTDFQIYKQRTGADPFIYSFDLQNYGTMQFPERNVFCLAGFSEKIFDIMGMLESDSNAMIKKIEEGVVL